MAGPGKPFPKSSRPAGKPPPSGSDGDRREERLIALFGLGCLMFSPLVLQIFSQAMPVIAGLPPFFLYAFGAWALLIALVAFVVETGGSEPSAEPPAEAADGGRASPKRRAR